MTAKDHIKKHSVLSHYRKGYLYYVTTDTNFTFRVPIEDTGDGTFRREERSMTLMRWIRKELESADKALPIDAGLS